MNADVEHGIEANEETGVMVAFTLAYGHLKKGARHAAADGQTGVKVALYRTDPVQGPMQMVVCHGRWKDYDLAARVALIVRGDQGGGWVPVPPQAGQDKFVLDRGHDWAMWYNGDGTATIRCRDHWPEDAWQGLRAAIVRLLGLPEVEAPQEAPEEA
jgi:hypothetical protein